MTSYKAPMILHSIDCIFRHFIDDILSLKDADDLLTDKLVPRSINTFVTWVKRFDIFSPYYEDVHLGLFEATSDYLLIRQIKRILVQSILSLSELEVSKLYVVVNNINHYLLDGAMYKMMRFIQEAIEEANDSFWEFKVGEEILVQLPDAAVVKNELYEVLDRECICYEGNRYYLYHLLGPDKQIYRIQESFVYPSHALG